MNKFKNNKKTLKITLAVLLLVISIGYALLNANLTINGTSNFARTTWNIHFENLQDNTNMTLGQNDSVATITQNKTNEVTYAVSFNEPGQFYEFTVDAKNDGTIDGMINSVTSTIKIGNGEATPITTNPSNLPAYMSYTATYSDGTPIEQYHLLASNQKETYKVRVEFRTDIEATDLPETDETIELTFGVEYVQKDTNAVPVVHPINGTRYTTNLYDTDIPDDNYVRINQTLPAQITFHETPEAAMAAFSNKPFYLKHTIVNNIVIESYVGFIVTDEMVAQAETANINDCNNDQECINSYHGMTAGTYYLRGGAGNESSLADKPIYESNKATLLSAFGSSNCQDNSSHLDCGVSGLLSSNVDSYGTIDVYDGVLACHVSQYGNSVCADY